jgi:hypothetical protein
MLFKLLTTGTPSITKSGWLSLTSDFVPRIVILTEEPVPPVELTVTPATRPARLFNTFSAQHSSSRCLLLSYRQPRSPLHVDAQRTTVQCQHWLQSEIDFRSSPADLLVYNRCKKMRTPCCRLRQGNSRLQRCS